MSAGVLGLLSLGILTSFSAAFGELNGLVPQNDDSDLRKTKPQAGVSDEDNSRENKVDENKPWSVAGRVTDADGKPIRGATVKAHCGMGTLFETGSAKTNRDGHYEFRFGPGIWSENKQMVQAATISVHFDDHFEKNLHRQGDLVAAMEKPTDEIGWGGKTEEHLFLPDKPKQVDFVMLPAASLRGRVFDKDGKSPEGIRVAITGPELPPSSNVIDSVRTNAKGEFEITGIPTGYKFQILVEPVKAEHPWLAWASPYIVFRRGETNDIYFDYEIDGKPIDFRCQSLYLMLKGDGVNWKSALQNAAERTLEFKWDGLSTNDKVRAVMASLELN